MKLLLTALLVEWKEKIRSKSNTYLPSEVWWVLDIKQNIATEYVHFVMSDLALEVSFVKSFLCDYDALMYDLSKFMTSS